MKRLAIAVPSVLVALVAIALIAPSFMDWNKYKGQAIEQAKTQAGLDLVINGDIKMGILPSPHLSVSDVVVKAPAGSASENLASMKTLNVHVALLPLLSGKIAVSSVGLEEPAITIEKLASGEFNYMTPALKAKMDAPKAEGAKGADISLSNIQIEKGAFTYIDTAKGSTSKIENFDADVSADTLQGPFDFDVALKYGAYDIAIEGEAGRFDATSKTISPKVNATISPGNIKIGFAGVVTSGEAFSAQGETTVSMDNVGNTLKDMGVKNINGLSTSMEMKGMLTASPAGVQIKDMNGKIGKDSFSGSVDVALNPMNIDARFKTDGNINLDDILPKAEAKEKKAFSLNVLPQTMSAPAGLNAAVTLEMASVTWKGQTLNDVSVSGGKGDKTFPFAVKIASLPGKGSADVQGALSYSGEGVNDKTGAAVYTNPSLTMNVKAASANLAETLRAFGGEKIPYANVFQSGSLTTGVTMSDSSIALQNGSAQLDDMQVSIAGSYAEAAKGARPKASIQLVTDALDWDALQAKLGVKKAEGEAKPFDPTALAQSLKLPLDLDFDVSAQSIKAAGYAAGGVRAKGALRENSISLDGLSVNDFAGANASVTGKIADVKAMSGIDVAVSGSATDVKKLAQTLKVKTDGLPANLSSAQGQVKLNGTLASMAMQADVKALGGQILAQGTLVNPLTQMEINALKVQVKHSNTSEAVRIFNPGFKGMAGLNKPLDVYTEVNRTGKSFQLSGIKGSVAGTDVNGSLSVNNEGAKPVINGVFQLGSLLLEPAPKEVAQTGGKGGSAPAQSGDLRWSREAIDTGWMSKADADIDIKAQAITYGNWNLKNPVLKASLKGGELVVSQLDAGLYGGSVALNGKMRSAGGARQPLYIEGAGKFTGVRLEDLVKGFVGSRILKAQGEVNMDMKITTSGISPAALIYDLAGNGTVNGKSITLEGIDVNRFARALSEESKAGDSLLHLWKGTAGGGSTSFETLDGNFTISEGVVNLVKMDLDGARSSIKTTGNVNLPRWTIATKHTITVKDRTDVPPFDITLSGPLDNPGQTFTQGLLQDYLNRKIERKIGNVLQEKLGEKGGALGQLLGLPGAQTSTTTPTTAPAPTEPTQVAPSSGTAAETAPVAPAPKTDEEKAQEAVEGLIKGLF